jgi:hypothetical protein
MGKAAVTPDDESTAYPSTRVSGQGLREEIQRPYFLTRFLWKFKRVFAFGFRVS